MIILQSRLVFRYFFENRSTFRRRQEKTEAGKDDFRRYRIYRRRNESFDKVVKSV